jgi:ribosomal protein S18 acetylase RimI-like enzyme
MKVVYSSNDELKEDEVISLYRSHGWSSSDKPKTLLKALNGSHSLVTARVDSMLVGLANAISDGHLVVYYPHMIVHSDFQRKGIGRGIMTILRERYANFHQQQLTADGEAVKFYESLGFVRSGKTVPMWIYQGNEH